ncbi:amino acid permease [Micromonospora echinofusca]|uniref:APC family permease n=1 Tax=Micromonospora echinofusca TaxID=47858 RepID=UPI00341EA3BC
MAGHRPPRGWSGRWKGAAVVFFAYTGFEAVANLGEETKRPRRDLTLGLLGTLLISTVLYIGVSLVVVGMVPYDQIDRGAPIAAAFNAVGAEWAGILVSIAAVAGLTSVILVDLVAMGRIGFAISRDGLIPPSIAKVHPRWGTPYRISAVMTVAVALLAGFLPLSALADLVSIGALAAFVLVSVAVPILRRKRPDLDRPFRVPFSPVLPIFSALACFYLMLNLSVETWLRFAAWMLLGVLIYFGYGYRRNPPGSAAAVRSRFPWCTRTARYPICRVPRCRCLRPSGLLLGPRGRALDDGLAVGPDDLV